MWVLVIYYLEHGLTAACRVLLFVTIMFMSAVAYFIVANDFPAALFTLKGRH